MGIGTTIAVGIGVAAVSGVVGRQQRREEADRVKRDAKEQQKKIQANYDRGKTQISLQREALADARQTADFQLGQAQDAFGRETDALDRARGATSREFARSISQLQRSSVRAHEQHHRESVNTMSQATAVGVRGGSGVDRARQDRAEGSADIEFAVNMERDRMGDSYQMQQAQFDDAEAAMHAQMTAISHQHQMQLSNIDRGHRDLDSAYSHLKTHKEVDTNLLSNAVTDAENAVDNIWNITGDVLGGFQSGFQLGQNLFGPPKAKAPTKTTPNPTGSPGDQLQLTR